MAERKPTSVNYLNETFLDDRCVLNKVLKIIGKRWVSEILLMIEKDVNRFSLIKENLDGISDNVLSHSLADLVKHGILAKKVFEEVPMRVEYGLTGAGVALLREIHNLCQWGRDHVEN